MILPDQLKPRQQRMRMDLVLMLYFLEFPALFAIAMFNVVLLKPTSWHLHPFFGSLVFILINSGNTHISN